MVSYVQEADNRQLRGQYRELLTDAIRTPALTPPPSFSTLQIDTSSHDLTPVYCAGNDDDFVNISSDKLANALHQANDLLGKGHPPPCKITVEIARDSALQAMLLARHVKAHSGARAGSVHAQFSDRGSRLSTRRSLRT